MTPKKTPRRHKTIVSGALNLEKVGVSRFDLSDPYHIALTLSWPGFFAALVVAYLLINLVFALFYFAAPGDISNLPAGSLVDAFFFSVETLATVGYGFMVPATRYGHVVATVEIFVGMLFTATMTGLLFVRFSKPKAKIIFADRIVVARQGGLSMLMVRFGNGRVNALADTNARLTVLLADTVSGNSFRRAVDLTLVRANIPLFPMTWTVMHALDDDSPLRHVLQGAADVGELRLMLSITARDPALGAQVYASKGYRGSDIMLGMRYANAVVWDGEDRSFADMTKISDVEPDLPA